MEEHPYDVSVIIPCLNEEETLGSVIGEAQKALQREKLSGEIIVVDNGSTDRSVAVATELGVHVVNEGRRGYGSSLTRGCHEAHAPYIVFADADESYDFGYVGSFAEKLRQGADLVIGNRLSGVVEKGAMPWLHRYIGTPVLTLIARFIFNLAIHDINCGMRGIRKETFTRLKLQSRGMEFASEMIIKASLAGCDIRETVIDFRKDKRGRPPHLKTFRDGWRHLRFMLIFGARNIMVSLGTIAMIIGAALMIAILANLLPHVGILTMLASQLCILSGAQVFVLGISCMGVADFGRFASRRDISFRIFSLFTIEKGLAVGVLLSTVGMIIVLFSGVQIYDFMRLTGGTTFFSQATKLGLAGITLVTLGVQVILSSLLLGLLKVEKIYSS